MIAFSHDDRRRRGDRVHFSFRDVTIEGYSLEPISIALYSKRLKALGRSKKLYRIRGFYSLDPQDRLVLLKVGDEYVNPCETFCREGLKVQVDYSAPLLVRFFSYLLNGYFQHRKLLRKKISWNLAVNKIKQLANHPMLECAKTSMYGKIREIESDLVIVGGGLAGLAAAYTANKLGLKSLIIDKSQDLGGRMRYDQMNVPGISISRENLLRDLLSKIGQYRNVSILTNTVFTGFFEDHSTAYSDQDKTLYVLKAKAFIIATGMIDIPCIFRNNDLPGIFSASTALEMINWYGVKLGDKGLIIGSSQNSLRIAEQLKQFGIDIILADRLKREDIGCDLSNLAEYIGNVREIEAIGKTFVEKVNIIHDSGVEKLGVDFIVCTAFSNPDIGILNQLNVKMRYIDNVGFIPLHDQYMHVKDNVFIAGGVTGSPYSILHMIEGEIAALSAAHMLGVKNVEPLIEEKLKEYMVHLDKMNIVWKNSIFESSRNKPRKSDSFIHPPTLFIEKPRRDAFICFCEDITTEDISKTVYEKGFTMLELVKRSLGVCTGRCQGRLCMINAALYVSYLSGLDPNIIGLTRVRAPTTSIPLYVLAGGEGE